MPRRRLPDPGAAAVQAAFGFARRHGPSTAGSSGSVWGLFAASAATAITLAILNEDERGDQTARFQKLHHPAPHPLHGPWPV